jgi:poly(hydroxyalkanoate) depolymerase family esterase
MSANVAYATKAPLLKPVRFCDVHPPTARREHFMTRYRNYVTCALIAASGLLVATPGHTASLQQVNNWNGGVSGLPSDVSMYIYVPDKVASNPPILTLVHYCGGTANAVFGQASGGGIVKAADQYGFIMVVPSSGRCWDIVSDKTRKRDGGGDSHAIVQMVRYAITKYTANAERVYSTGDSSGGMMTELLLALYPDVFKAGAAFAGMPAGCRGATESGNGGGYSNACAGGTVSRTPEEWGNLVRSFYPSYTGHRPRVQLFHGDADTTIKYPNFTEAVKEWTNVLSLNTTPTSTDSSLKLGTHSSTRQSWKNACGYVVLDAFTSIGGDHGPSDALFPAQYVIPFLGLDKTGATDPEIAQCGTAGTGGTSSTGGSTSTGGASGTTGGTSSVSPTGGSSATPGAGGTKNTGGTSSFSSQTTTGGVVSTAGTTSVTIPSLGVGGGSTTAPTANGGASVHPTGTVAANGGAAVTTTTTKVDSTGDSDSSDGCSCHLGGTSSSGGWLALLLGAGLLLRRRAKS